MGPPPPTCPGASLCRDTPAPAHLPLPPLPSRSDVWLDRPDTLRNLEKLFGAFQGLVRMPLAFVLAGDFLSNASTSHVLPAPHALRSALGALGQVIAKFPRVAEESRIVLVPGPNDLGPGNVLPRPPLAASLLSELEAFAAVEATTNPCRIRYADKELVVFRDDLQHKMRRMCLLTPHGDPTKTDEEENEMFESMVSTQLRQSHVCPLPLSVQPVMWDHDHALRLYPLPDALVMADRTDAAHATVGDDPDAATRCMNPGSFGATGTFVCYLPNAGEGGEVEVSQVTADE